MSIIPEATSPVVVDVAIASTSSMDGLEVPLLVEETAEPFPKRLCLTYDVVVIPFIVMFIFVDPAVFLAV